MLQEPNGGPPTEDTPMLKSEVVFRGIKWI